MCIDARRRYVRPCGYRNCDTHLGFLGVFLERAVEDASIALRPARAAAHGLNRAPGAEGRGRVGEPAGAQRANAKRIMQAAPRPKPKVARQGRQLGALDDIPKRHVRFGDYRGMQTLPLSKLFQRRGPPQLGLIPTLGNVVSYRSVPPLTLVIHIPLRRPMF